MNDLIEAAQELCEAMEELLGNSWPERKPPHLDRLVRQFRLSELQMIEQDIETLESRRAQLMQVYGVLSEQA